MRLLCSASAAELSLGHLIQQSATSANRGAYRGSGFEARSDAWVTVRAAQGLLVSTTTRSQQGTSVASTQMDSQEAIAQLKAAQSLGRTLGDAAGQQQASSLPSHQKDDKAAFEQLMAAIDPKRDGKHGGNVNGQPAKKANPGSRTLQDPVEKFARPMIVLDTPSTLSWATPASALAFAGLDQSWVAQGDAQITAAKTLASVSGETTSLYTHTGGMQVIAANAPISLRAHTDQLALQADGEVTIVSVDDEIKVLASTKIEFIAGQSKITLDGVNITFACPGSFTVKAGSHGWRGPGSGAAEFSPLPDATAGISVVQAVGLGGEALHIAPEAASLESAPDQASVGVGAP